VSGTNAHVILEQAAAEVPAQTLAGDSADTWLGIRRTPWLGIRRTPWLGIRRRLWVVWCLGCVGVRPITHCGPRPRGCWLTRTPARNSPRQIIGWSLVTTRSVVRAPRGSPWHQSGRAPRRTALLRGTSNGHVPDRGHRATEREKGCFCFSLGKEPSGRGWRASCWVARLCSLVYV